MSAIIVGIPHTTRMSIMGPPPQPNRAEYPYVGSISYQGILIYVENAPGSLREGTDADGNPWRIQMQHFYGEIPDTQGSDGDPVDVYVGDNPNAEIAYVIHQKFYFGTEHEVEGTYDEDKIMLGFSTKDEALAGYAAHFNRPIWMPGVTTMTVDELKQKIEDGELELGGAVVKAGPRKYKRRWRGPDGKWRYEYHKPKAASHAVTVADDDERAKAMEAALERDPSRGVDGIKAGEIVEVGGRSGRYKWVPGARRSGSMTTAVQSMETGAVELVRANTLIALRTRRKAAPAPKRKRKAPPPPPTRPTAPEPPSDWPKGGGDRENITLPPPTDRASLKARKADVWTRSTAEAGTVLAAMEDGSLMLRQFRGRNDKRTRLTIEVPADMKEKLAVELTPLFHKAARRVASSFRPRIPIVVGGTNELHPDYKELVAGAQLGFVMALTNYRGGRAFIPVALDYATVYAAQAARGIRRGHALKERDLRALKGYIAARSRAANVQQRKSGAEPSQEAIIKQWYVTKRMTFTGRGESLGNYERDGRIVDQAHEQVPLDDWQVVTPTGQPEGQTYPGKKKLAEKMVQLLSGEDVADDEWLSNAPSNLLPNYDDLAMSAGAALHVRREVITILDTMGDPHGTALAMRFGMYVPEDENPDTLQAHKLATLKAMAKDRGLKASGNKGELATRILQWSAGQTRPGTKGYEASAVQVAEVLDLGQNLAPASQAAKIRRIWKDGIGTFQRKAIADHASIAEYVSMWAPELTKDPAPSTQRQGPLLPSHEWLKGRFGTDERVYVYQASMRAGTGSRTGRMLERENAGELSPQESAQLRDEYHAQRRKDAHAALKRYKAVTVDPDRAHDIGPDTGTPGEAEWLYSSNVITDYMRARIRGGKE